jgi:hypothetical protein
MIHPAQAATPTESEPPPELDAAASSTLAQELGESVEVVALTTPTQRIVALPDGSMQYETSSVPVRTEQGPDNWVPINTDLVLREGWWEPAASATPVRFAIGGSEALDQVRTADGDWLEETWPHGELPVPEIDGPTATYADVLPGVDLKLTATELGMASVYVVKSAKAAASDVLSDLHVVLEDAEVTKSANGTFTAQADGDSITATSPLWWDSSDGGTYVSPGEDSLPMPVDHSFTDSSINMDVPATIEGKRPTYPIFIDPDWTAGAAAAWYTDVAYPNQSYLSAGQSDVLRVGRYNPYRGNMFFDFSTTPLAGKQVLSAQLSTTQIGLAACPNSPLQVRLFGPQTPGFSWNQQNHNLWGPVLDTQSPGTCGSGPMTVGWNVSAGVQARSEWSSIQFGFAPQDENANSRRHFSRSATLIVNYNSPPNAPTAPQIDSPPRSCGTAAAPAYVSGSSVVASVHQTDPDPGNVDTNFALIASPSLTHLLTKSSGLLAQGRRSVTFSNLGEGNYAWYARGSDWRIDGNGASAWCYFTIDNTPPPAPSVTTTATTFTVGQPLNVSVAGSADTAGYQYWLSYSASTTPVPPAPVEVSRTAPLPDCAKRVSGTRFACANGTTPVNISVAPVDALSTLWVAAYDKSGNVSPARALPLYTAAGTPAARDPRIDNGHAWLTTWMIDPLPVEVDDANWGSALPLHLPTDGGSWDSVTELRPGYTVPVLQPHEPAVPGETMGTLTAAVDSTESFSVSMWVKPLNKIGTQTRQVIATQSSPTSEFSLSLQEDQYEFCRGGTPGPGQASALVSSCVRASTKAVTGEWALVTGVWDRTNEQLRLAVGGSPSPVAVMPNARGTEESWTGGGAFLIGPPPTSWRFAGLVANPVVVPGVLDSRQLGSLVSFDSPFTF